HRPGRVDTGKPTVNNAQHIHAAIIRQALRNNAYIPTDLYWFPQDKAGVTKCVVVSEFSPVSREAFEKAPEVPRRSLDALRALARTTWNFCHIWENPDGVVTVNFVGRMPEMKPRRAVVIRKGAIEIGLVDALLPEEEESELAMNAAFQLWQGAGINPHITDTKAVAEKVGEAAERRD
ncbi:MAG: hypothetical protein KW806_02715, partial [Candidatus Yanofskybacteria bacterium]|nr:hypothetical protein [Candidatus Yanofskybacteria bacterium]